MDRVDRQRRRDRLQRLSDGTLVGSTTTQLSYTVGSLTCGSSYEFAVEARDAANNKSARKLLNASTNVPAGTTAPPPSGSNLSFPGSRRLLLPVVPGDVDGRRPARQLPPDARLLQLVRRSRRREPRPPAPVRRLPGRRSRRGGARARSPRRRSAAPLEHDGISRLVAQVVALLRGRGQQQPIRRNAPERPVVSLEVREPRVVRADRRQARDLRLQRERQQLRGRRPLEASLRRQPGTSSSRSSPATQLREPTGLVAPVRPGERRAVAPTALVRHQPRLLARQRGTPGSRATPPLAAERQGHGRVRRPLAARDDVQRVGRGDGDRERDRVGERLRLRARTSTRSTTTAAARRPRRRRRRTRRRRASPAA